MLQSLQGRSFEDHSAAPLAGDTTKKNVGVPPEMSLRLVAVQSPLQKAMQSHQVEMGLKWIVMQVHLLLHGAL